MTMANHKACSVTLLAVIVLVAGGCALIPSEQHPIPPDVLKEMDRQAQSNPNHLRKYLTYEGEYLCAQGGTGMSLQVIGEENINARYAIFHFFPLASNPNVPPGSFAVKGVFDEVRGIIDMEPVSWITRPAGFIAAGLRGVSTDGGNTFEGQLTGVSFLCSTFAMRRSAKLP
jgi:hypothetical protein